MYIGTYVNWVLKSTDDGLTFSKMNTGLSNLTVTQVLLSSITPEELYAANGGGGVAGPRE